MKKRLFMLFSLIICGFLIFSGCTASTEAVELDSASVGDYVTFSHYEQDNNMSNGKEAIEWKVLDKKNGRALLLSKYGLDAKPYNETDTDVTWENCTLRSWLNSSFLEEAFSTSEKSAIPTVTLSNPDNTKYGTEGGNKTNDQVFILNLQEIQQYFDLSDKWTDYDGNEWDSTKYDWCIGGSKDAIISPTAYAEEQGADAYHNYHDAEGSCVSKWWLRSPGEYGYSAACVGYNGNVDQYGVKVNKRDYTVRPALWVNLAS